jgi:hypothetical protein
MVVREHGGWIDYSDDQACGGNMTVLALWTGGP